MTTQHIPQSDPLGISLDNVQRHCAGLGCARSVPFNADLPDGWRWLLLWHADRATPDALVAEIVNSEMCQRDAVLCPVHAERVEGLLQRLDRANVEAAYRRQLAVVRLLETFHPFHDIGIGDLIDGHDHLIARYVAVPKTRERFTLLIGASRHVACIGLDDMRAPSRVLWSNVVPGNSVGRSS